MGLGRLCQQYVLAWYPTLPCTALLSGLEQLCSYVSGWLCYWFCKAQQYFWPVCSCYKATLAKQFPPAQSKVKGRLVNLVIINAAIMLIVNVENSWFKKSGQAPNMLPGVYSVHATLWLLIHSDRQTYTVRLCHPVNAQCRTVCQSGSTTRHQCVHKIQFQWHDAFP